ncbi:MAG: aldehyde dehydrogenase family protein [Desulfobacterales bacterium]|nr:aldehyde dehydrogenase family protein [Desulfobacterales bacterium]
MKTVDELMDAGRRAQARVADYTQEQIDDVCLAIGWQLFNQENITRLSELAVEETGYGNVESKIAKHHRKVFGVLKDIRGAKTVGLLERDEAKGISKYAKPMGVVCAILPATNPTATAGSNALSILKCRNAVIFRPSSRAEKCSALAIAFMRRGLAQVGAPEDLIQIMEAPSREATKELMIRSDLVVATGGAPMVKAAYSSGTPSHGVGAGNAVAMVAEDADVADAIAKVTASKTFDYATSCSSENSLIVQDGVYDEVMSELRKNKGYICNAEEKETLKNWMWLFNEKKQKYALNPQVVAQSALKIAACAGLKVPDDTQMLIVEGSQPAVEDKFADEKISPVLAIFRYDEFKEGVEMLMAITDRYGRGHSSGIHTFKREYIDYLGETLLTSRITVRQPMAAANGGHLYNAMPCTTTLGCGSWGGNATTENVHYKQFLNVTWVNEPITPCEPTPEEMWGAFWQKFGRPENGDGPKDKE